MSEASAFLENLDRLVHEDIVLARKIARVEQARDAFYRYYSQKAREEAKPLDEELAPLEAARESVRETILTVWAGHCDSQTTLDLPCAKVSRRNYRELVIHDCTALYDALDRADRLDLTHHAFDQQAVAKLIAAGHLEDLPEGSAQVIDHHNLQVRAKETRSA